MVLSLDVCVCWQSNCKQPRPRNSACDQFFLMQCNSSLQLALDPTGNEFFCLLLSASIVVYRGQPVDIACLWKPPLDFRAKETEFLWVQDVSQGSKAQADLWRDTRA